MHPIHKMVFTLGMYTCPLDSVGCRNATLGQKFKLIASLMSVKDPLIKACEAMMAAAVAMIMPGIRNQPGMIS